MGFELASLVVRRNDAGSPELAGAEDAAALLALREAAAAWLADRGIRQWEPGEVALQDVSSQVEAGQWYVVRQEGLHDALAAAGVPIPGAPFDGPFGRTFTFTDPDGYAVTIHDQV